MLYTYKPDDVQRCLSQRPLTFLGDSTARELFWAISYKLDHRNALELHSESGKHQNITFRSDQAQVKFIWDPFLNASSTVDQHRLPVSTKDEKGSDLLVVGAGLWHIKHLGAGYQRAFSDFLRAYIESRPGSLNAIFLPISTSQSYRLTANLSKPIEPQRAGQWNQLADEILSLENDTMKLAIFRSYLDIIEGVTTAFEPDGIHISQTITPVIADVLLNSLCNPLGHLREYHSTIYCCIPTSSPNTVQKFLLLLGLAFVIYHLLKYLKHRNAKRHSSDGSPTRDRRPCVANSVTSILIALIYCFVADRTVLFEKASKLVDPTFFVVLSGLMLLLGLGSLAGVASPITTFKDIAGLHPRYSRSLSRSQTEEWKGWMQIVILLYHYFGMSKVLWAYQLARVLVASYLFMTGYGHTMYFLRTGDFSFQRVGTVVFRTNVLSIMLAFVMGTQFDLYYFPMLSSSWFLIIYITMVPLSKSRLTASELIFRIVLSALIVRTLISASSTIESLLQTLANLGVGFIKIDGKELIFRFRLDAYVVYFGMFAAIYCSRDYVNNGASTETSPILSTNLFQHLHRLAVPGSFCLLSAYACFCWTFADKYDYNRWHPFTSPFAVVAFVILRNSTERLSRSYSRLFAWFGRCSLETFVLQYHIWLAADSRGLLRLSRFDLLLRSARINTGFWTGMIEFAILSALFLWTSSRVSSALPILTAKVLDESGGQIKRFRCKPDLTKPARPALEPKALFVNVRTVVFISALLLWGLNLCWLYFE